MDNSVINIEEGLKRVMNNKKLYHRLLGKFSGKKLADEIVLAIEKEDYIEISKGTHALRGVSANLAMPSLTNVAERIEAMAKAEISPAELVNELNNAVESVETAIAAILADQT